MPQSYQVADTLRYTDGFPAGEKAIAVLARAVVDASNNVVIDGANLASIGASTVALTGAIAVNDVTTPSVTLTDGSTNTGFFWVKGKTSGSLKITTADATAQAVILTAAAQTVGGATFTIPNAAGAAQTLVTLALTQTLTNKTLTSPVIGTGLTASGSAANDFSGSTGTFLTSSGANTIGANLTTAFTVIQTSAAAAAFATGLAGNTNPVFRTVNNIVSQATGISITGRAAAAGADITVLSSGTDENLVINAKGAGTITLNPTGTGNIAFSRTATGSTVILTAGVRFTPTVYTSDGAITLASGLHLIEKTSAAAMTVAAPSSQDGERLIIQSNTDFAHVVTFSGSTLLDGTTGANLTVTMTAFKGSSLVVIARGTKWLLESSSNVTSITT